MAFVKKKAPVKRAPRVRSAPKEPEPQSHGFAFYGQGLEYAALVLINHLLNLVTLGIYRGFAVVRRYRYLYGRSEFMGERFAFKADGWELLVAYLVVGAFFSGFYIGIFFVMGQFMVGIFAMAVMVGFMEASGQGAPSNLMMAAAFLLLAALILHIGIGLGCLVEWLHYRSRAFRASKTRWRGVGFRLEGHAGDYVAAMMKARLRALATLGFRTPDYFFERDARLYRDLRFGDLRFEFVGELAAYRRMFYRGILLTLLTLGLYLFIFIPQRQRFFFDNLALGENRFRLEMSNGEFIRFNLMNLLLLLLTLGLAYPWVAMRNWRFYAERMKLEGGEDLDKALAKQGERDRGFGEGGEGALEIDGGAAF